ncbi:MAG TPA: thermonuclease family protein [Candidatus Omnitrophota bacterium]|nr:thermonuclease family protein [Candidatus Omnitrophota bacterium]HPT38700.1 thermonuclease family protein [Candidatus Omnitrophota bacterium]
MKKNFWVLLILGLLVAAGWLFAGDLDPSFHSKEEVKWKIPFGKNYDYTNILVTRVVDGDTLILENNERVRLIGIDTPEMHESDKLNRDGARYGQDLAAIRQMGRQAYEIMKEMAEGKHVRLEFDVERFDKYRRILAYVYLLDGTFLNAKIVEQGYASLMTYPPNVRYADLFSRLYRQAREDRRGLWK